MRSFATMREGMASLAFRLLHWQLVAGQPHPGHIRPFSVEYTVRDVMATLSRCGRDRAK
jgi:hypothetical protein